jgi:DNA-directed RNA polymerase subunit omega
VQQQDSMIEPRLEQLLEPVDSKFTLVTLGSRRARQINSYYHRLGDGLGAVVPPQVTSVARKPLSIAFEEIAAGKIVVAPPAPEGEGDDPEGENADADGGVVLEAIEGGAGESDTEA